MGPMKDALFLEVWRYLHVLPQMRTLLTALNSPLSGPQEIRTAWSQLQLNGRTEGMKKKTGLQAVLAERPDIFRFVTTERGHLIIELTEAARVVQPGELLATAGHSAEGAFAGGVMATATTAATGATGATVQQQWPELAPDGGMQPGHPLTGALPGWPELAGLDAIAGSRLLEQQVAALPAPQHWQPDNMQGSSDAASGDALPEPMPVGAVRGLPLSEGSEPVPPAAKKAKTASPGAELQVQVQQQPPVVEPPPATSMAGRSLGSRISICTKGKGKNGLYMDLVWTPQLQAAKKLEQQKDAEMACALFKALEMHGGQAVTLSQLGSDFKVAQLKRHSLFKNVRLLDILRQYEDIFELTPDGISGGWTVRGKPGAQAALPGAETIAEQTRQVSLMLPDRIENPIGTKEKMQSLRIELLHALSRRGSRVPLQELGQEARVQQRKAGLHQAKKLIDFIRIFPENFTVSSDDTQMVVEIASTNVADQSMIELSIQRSQQALQSMSKGGKGFGNRPRQSSQTSRPLSSSASRPAQALPSVPSGFHGGGFDYNIAAQINAAASMLGNSMQHVGGVPALGYAHHYVPL